MRRSFLVLVSVFAAALFLVPSATFAATISVPADMPTIQSAIDAALPGDTIVVAAGTYHERVTINKSLTLKGANAGTPGNRSRGAESVLAGDSDGAVVVAADDVTLDGFEVSSAFNDLSAGVYMEPTQSGALMINNIITGNQIGMYANSAGSSTISHNLFEFNNDAGSLGGGTGIFSEFSNHLTLDSNEFRNHTTNIPVIFSATSKAVHKSLVVSNNSIHDNISAVFAIGVSGGTFANNDISAAGATAMSFGGGGNTDISIIGNNLHDSARGIRFEDVGFELGDDSAIIINRNSIENNALFGVVNTSGFSGEVDATCNWWGAANGPGPVGIGSGNKVSSGVNFTPWLTSRSLNSPCNGTPTGSLTVQKIAIGGNSTFDFVGDNALGAFQITTFTGTSTNSGSTTLNNLNPGTYSITETPKTGWTMTRNNCTGIVIVVGSSTVCTITDTFSSKPPPGSISLKIVVQVDNTGGGSAVPASFITHLKKADVEAVGSPAPGVASPGKQYPLTAGTYVVSESTNALYTQSFSGFCNASGVVVLTDGQNKTCIITNTFIPSIVPPPPQLPRRSLRAHL